MISDFLLRLEIHLFFLLNVFNPIFSIILLVTFLTVLILLLIETLFKVKFEYKNYLQFFLFLFVFTFSAISYTLLKPHFFLPLNEELFNSTEYKAYYQSLDKPKVFDDCLEKSQHSNLNIWYVKICYKIEKEM